MDVNAASNIRLRQLAIELVGLKLQLEGVVELEDRTRILRRIRDVEVEVLAILRDQAAQLRQENDNMARALGALIKRGGSK
jgi:hypothetical protein